MVTRWLKWTFGAAVLAALVGGCMEQPKPASLTGDATQQGPVDINGDLP